jgi:uncharacterized protein YbaR (Trm112 family)
MSLEPLAAKDLRWLVCPVCHQQLHLEDDAIRCLGCERRYPIIDGIPILLEDRAK